MAQSINESKTDYTIQYNNSVYNPYDLNNNYIIEISEISAAVDDFLNGQLSISEISELVDFFLSGDEYDIPVGEPEILSSSSYIEYDDFHLVGEVRNNLDQNIEYVKIIGTFYNEYNEVIGTDYTYTDIDILKPGQKSPFELTTYPDSFIPASYKLQLSYSTTSSEPYENVIIKSHTSDNDGDYFEVVGEVQNDGEETVEYVKIIGTFYNEDDIVIGKDYSYTTLDIITSGDTSPFELSSYPQTINPSRYDLQVRGSEIEYQEPLHEPEILSSSSYIEYDDFHLVGEVQNNLDQNIEYVKIVGTFYNEQNEVIGMDYTYTDIDILKPGQKSPFELNTYPDSFIPDSYKLQLSYSTTSSEPYENVIIKSHTSDNDGDYFEVVGEVQNDGEETVEYVKIIGTFYNEDDIVIGKDYSYSTLDIITSGDTSPFELSSFPQTINPSRYDLQTQARVVD
ncbi:hypothetical protein BHR79_08330 [Methanohalophilus halophilus]|uniref:Uncharacterized protein n=1 Tax=Methanohalophilus halophilus TaxID=2177 RepID=A0A1L3Q3Q3_9EURY|nr:FxLYD domain-containing protein [Methanohalophilus halophilus]APH39485.1 hypothetical protein BHR79_08330 [Methanohalophilus halophilus]RNI07266.1 hypothetical protein EFE40_10360 [Methanohalophilus halophilus]